MSEEIKKIKISDLPTSSSVNDEDIFIKSDNIETSKIAAGDIAEYVTKKVPIYTHHDSGVIAGTYQSVTVDKYGHVTAGSTPTTLSGYGITDAATKSQGEKADTAVQSVKIGTTEYKSDTTVILPDYPTSLPASDVYEWAKAETKPAYTASEIGADESGSANTAYENAKSYTDSRIAQLIGTSPENLDTIEELGNAISENQTAIDAIENAITNKADIGHTHDKSYASKESEHSHNNKTILDSITSDKVLLWDNKSDFDGNYNSLKNTPTIPTNVSQLINDAEYITSVDIENFTSDTANNTITFISGDEDEPTEWSDVTVIASKEKHSSLLNKISTMIKNVRYLHKMFTSLNTNLTANNVPFRFGYTETGEYGYIIQLDGADTVIPFKKSGNNIPISFVISTYWNSNYGGGNNTFRLQSPHEIKKIIFDQANIYVLSSSAFPSSVNVDIHVNSEIISTSVSRSSTTTVQIPELDISNTQFTMYLEFTRPSNSSNYNIMLSVNAILVQ